MVAASYYENLEREQREREQAEQEARERNRTAGNWIKGILGLATFNEGVWRGATSGSTDKFLQMSADADPVQIALGVATMVAFSYAGGLGSKLGAKNPKGGKLLTYNKVVENAKSKGYTIDPKIKPQVEAEINKVNNMTEREQLEGLQKIRTDTIEQATKLLRSASESEKPKLEQTIRESTAKLQEGGQQIQLYDLNKADPYKQYKLENGKIVEDLQASVENLNKLDPDIQFKVENNAIVRDRKQADPEVIKRNEAITEENLRIAEESIRQMNERIRKANEEAKAEDKKIDEDPDFDEKGEPDGDQVIETKEPLDKSDEPNFGDEVAEGKEAEAGDKETDLAGKAAGAGGAAIITTEVVEKLTRGGDDETRRRRNFELDDESGFTKEPVKEGEEGTQSTQAPTPAPAPAQATISYVNHKEKRTQNTENIDELFSITIKMCTDVYDNRIGEERNYFYNAKFKVPFLIFISQKILYLAFRGTKGVSNVLTDLKSAYRRTTQTSNTSNFLYNHHPFKDILDPVASNIEFHLGVILALKESYQEIIKKLEQADHLVNSIVVTGHSLGGAMAQLFTYVYNNSNKNKFNRNPIKHLVTYGQPRILVDKPEYVNLFENSVDNYHRVWNTKDPIAYVPFKKKVTLDKMLDDSNIFSGWTHVGDSFNLAGNIVNNDVDLLLYEILKGNKEKIEMLLEKKDLLTNSKLLKFMLSDKYLSLQLYTFYKCLEEVEVKEEITQEQLTFLTMELQKDTSKLLNYAEKCDLVKPWGIADILKMNPIGDDLDEENFSLQCLSGVSISSCKTSNEAHKLEYYHSLLDELIARQINDKKPIFEVIDRVDFYERKTNLFDGVIGMTEGDFNNGDVVIF